MCGRGSLRILQFQNSCCISLCVKTTSQHVWAWFFAHFAVSELSLYLAVCKDDIGACVALVLCAFCSFRIFAVSRYLQRLHRSTCGPGSVRILQFQNSCCISLSVKTTSEHVWPWFCAHFAVSELLLYLAACKHDIFTTGEANNYYYYYYYYLLQLGFHPVAVVLTLVHKIQMDI
jgi:hypothetical protein